MANYRLSGDIKFAGVLTEKRAKEFVGELQKLMNKYKVERVGVSLTPFTAQGNDKNNVTILSTMN